MDTGSDNHCSNTVNNIPATRVWRFSNGLMGLFFCFCATVQYNDPDPELWMPVYAIAGLIVMSLAINPDLQCNNLWRLICCTEITLILGMVAYVYMYVTAETQSAIHGYNPLHYEEGREIMGLIIVLLWIVAVCLLYAPSRQKFKYSKLVEVLLAILITSLAVLPMTLYGICQVGTFSDKITYCRLMCSNQKG